MRGGTRRRDEHHEGARHDGRSRPAVADGSARLAHRRRGAERQRQVDAAAHPRGRRGADRRPRGALRHGPRICRRSRSGGPGRRCSASSRAGPASRTPRRGWTPGGDDYHDALERFLALGGADLEPRARKVCARLGIDVPLDAELPTLSGGEAARVSLAALLLSRVDVLCLDEPTNDLDFDGLERLEQFVQGYRGSVVLVSHDREFLDRTVTRIVAFEAETRKVTSTPARTRTTRASARSRSTRQRACVRGVRRRARPLRDAARRAARAGAPRRPYRPARDAGAQVEGRAGEAPARAPRGGREAVAPVAARARARAATRAAATWSRASPEP